MVGGGMEMKQKDKKLFRRIIILLIATVMMVFIFANITEAGKEEAPALQRPVSPDSSKKILLSPAIRKLSYPDLTLKVFKGLPGYAAIGIQVFNVGKSDAGPFKVTFTCDHWPEGEHQFMSKCNLPAIIIENGIKPGEVKHRYISESDAGFKKGYHYSISATVDSDNQVAESNENNNWAVTGFTY